MLDITKIKAVLWDLDDTLYSRVNAARCVFPLMFKELLYVGRSDEEIEEMADFMKANFKRNSVIHEDVFSALFKRYPPDKPYIREDCVNFYHEHISKFAKPFPDVTDIIKSLRKLGIKTAVVTNVAEDRVYSQNRKIAALGIGDLFDAIVYSGELGVHKPDRRIFDEAVKLLGVSNKECLFVGDDPISDVAGALSADMEVIWIDRFEYDGSFDKEPRVHRVSLVSEYFGKVFL